MHLSRGRPCLSSLASNFEQHRLRLTGVAYRMLGSRTEAEDVVQDAYLRWHSANHDEIRSSRAWLLTTVTRLAIDRLRELRARRETYVGPWLPEPLVSDTAPAADAATELASSLSVAFLVVMERLAPEERAAFLLHDVFESNYDEIAQILGRSEVACRQVVSRARKRIRADRPRVQVSEAARTNLLQRFAQAVMTQDKAALMELLALDATWTSDGGGKAKAARKTIHGREAVARFVMGVLGRHASQLEIKLITVNGEAGLAVHCGSQLISITSMKVDGAQILEAYAMLNPEKLPVTTTGATPSLR